MIDAKGVTAVVVTYNRLPLLKKCLAALRAQTVQGFTVLLVDNASTDGTAEYGKALSGPGLVYRNTGENLGGAGGFAYGIRAAAEQGCEAVWIMDDDTLPEPDALENLLAADAAHGDGYGWLSSRALAPDGADQPMNVQRKTMYRDIDPLPKETTQEVPAVMASFVSLFLRTETVRRFGLPIAEFFIWSDDWEYTRRISRVKPCYVVTASRVVHAMQNPGVVNIAKDVPARWARYRYFYRNDVVLYRREGLVGWLWLLAKDVWHTVQVLRDGQGHRAERIGIIWKGFAAGVRFHPQIPYLS
ncbi:glycosyltransferase family 2 protein [Gemmiger sp.]